MQTNQSFKPVLSFWLHWEHSSPPMKSCLLKDIRNNLVPTFVVLCKTDCESANFLSSPAINLRGHCIE